MPSIHQVEPGGRIDILSVYVGLKMHPAWYLNIALALALQGLLFFRAQHSRLLLRYPLFYFYQAYTMLWTIVLSLVQVLGIPSYPKIYWWSQIVACTLRLGIAAEVYRHTFPSQSPVRRKSQIIVLIVLLFLATLFAASGPGPGRYAFLDVSRKIALTVVAWTFVILILARHYRIQMGRNVFGMSLGLMIFTGSELVHLSAMDLVPGLWPVWRFVHPIAFVFMLSIWTFALWNYRPNPEVTQIESVRARRLEMAWQERWMDVPRSPRKVLRP